MNLELSLEEVRLILNQGTPCSLDKTCKKISKITRAFYKERDSDWVYRLKFEYNNRNFYILFESNELAQRVKSYIKQINPLLKGCQCKSQPHYHRDDCLEFDIFGNEKW